MFLCLDLVIAMLVRSCTAFRSGAIRLARPGALAPLRWQPCRALSQTKPPAPGVPPAEEPKESKPAPPAGTDAKAATSATPTPPANAAAASAAGLPPAGSAGAPPDGGRSALTISDEEESAPPPMEWEPGVAGTVQKGFSAIIIAFGAAAFGACALGAYWALFPGSASPGTIFEEAADKVKVDPEVADRLGTPIKAYGADFGGGEGRRNFVQSWEVEGDDGKAAIQVKFNVQGPQGRGVVHAQAATSRSRGQFNFIVFEDKRRRDVVYVVDNREQLKAASQVAQAAREAAAVAAAAKTPPPPAAAPAA